LKKLDRFENQILYNSIDGGSCYFDNKISLLFGETWKHERGTLQSAGSLESFPFLKPLIQLFNNNCQYFNNTSITSILSIALLTQIRLHTDHPIEVNSAIQSFELFGGTGNAILLPKIGWFSLSPGWLYGFFGKNVHLIQHGVVSCEITKLLKSGKKLKSSKNFFKSMHPLEIKRISLVARTCKNVPQKVPAKNFHDFWRKHYFKLPQTLENVTNQLLKDFPIQIKREELNNCFAQHGTWQINNDLLMQYNSTPVYSIQKELILPKLVHLLYVLGLAQTSKGGKSFHGSKQEGVKFVFSSQIVFRKKSLKIPCTSTMLAAVQTSINNCTLDDWFSWVFECNSEKKYCCLGRYWIYSENHGIAKFYPHPKKKSRVLHPCFGSILWVFK